jgi:hypothetical protein
MFTPVSGAQKANKRSDPHHSVIKLQVEITTLANCVKVIYVSNGLSLYKICALGMSIAYTAATRKCLQVCVRYWQTATPSEIVPIFN